MVHHHSSRKHQILLNCGKQHYFVTHRVFYTGNHLLEGRWRRVLTVWAAASGCTPCTLWVLEQNKQSIPQSGLCCWSDLKSWSAERTKDCTQGRTPQTPKTHQQNVISTLKASDLNSAWLYVLTFPTATLSGLNRMLSSFRAGVFFRDWIITERTNTELNDGAVLRMRWSAGSPLTKLLDDTGDRSRRLQLGFLR